MNKFITHHKNLTIPFNFRLLFLSCILFFNFSCSKDTDLLSEYVLSEGFDANNFENIYVVDDQYQLLSSNSMVLDVLANDVKEEQDEVVITEISNPAHGVVEINTDETITYTSVSETTVTDTFTYTTEIVNEDETVTSETGTVTVIVDTKTDKDYGILKAFPAAYGGGSQVTGGRGGRVIYVTNLNDSGAGSFREAFMASGTRTILFKVSGTINLTSGSLSTAHGNVTIAGQTAPEGGITFTGSSVPIFEISGRSNIIMRYIKVRPTFLYGNDNADAIQFFNCSNIILDHVSASWGGDEAIDFTSNTSMSNITIQNSLIAESKNGGIIGSVRTPSLVTNLSQLGNLFVDVDHRQLNTVTNNRVDVINNVIWGYGYRINRPAPSNPKINELNNYYASGTGRALHDMHKIDFNGNEPQIYSKGNLHIPSTVINPNLPNTNNTWSVFSAKNKGFGFTYNGNSYFDDYEPPASFFTNVQHNIIGELWPIMTALEALEYVKTNTGANKSLDGSGNVITQVDPIDTVYLARVNSGVASDVAFPFRMVNQNKSHYDNFISSVSSTPINTRPVNYDTDNDGMPDAWELSKGFDLNKMDHNDDLDGNGYTNLEEYINLVDF